MKIMLKQSSALIQMGHLAVLVRLVLNLVSMDVSMSTNVSVRLDLTQMSQMNDN